MNQILSLEEFHLELQPTRWSDIIEGLRENAEEMTDLLLNDSEYVHIQKRKGKIKTMHKNSKNYKESMKNLFYVENFGPFFLCTFEVGDLQSIEFEDLADLLREFREYQQNRRPNLQGLNSRVRVRLNGNQFFLTTCNVNLKLFVDGFGNRLLFLGDFHREAILVFYFSYEIPFSLKMQVYAYKMMERLHGILASK